MPNSRPLTLETLRIEGARCRGLTQFHELFGHSVSVAEELAAEHASKFDYDWAVNHLLSPQARAAHYICMEEIGATYNIAEAQIEADYKVAKAEIWAAFVASTEAERQARGTYSKAHAQAYEEARERIWGTYCTALKLAQSTYEAAMARSWARAYINDGEKVHMT